MRKKFRRLSLLLISAMVIMPASAVIEPNSAPNMGAVTGRIVDSNKQVLPGATVQIESLHTGVVSDINGYYTFPNLKPGTYTVKVSYVGFEPKTMKLVVKSNKTEVHDFVLSDGVELKGIEVQGAFHGQRRALQMQKENMGISNIVSADQVGKFPDSNIGDALKRINGINVQYDQGEARFGQVRGTSPDLSSVTINGDRMPSAEGDARNVQLDLIPADMIQTIEVSKVVTADMDGDAIGGSINLVTKNSPYRRVLSATAGSGYGWISDKMQLNLGLTYGDRFFNNKLGVLAAVSYMNTPAGSDNTEFEYDVNKDDKVVLNNAEVRQYYVTRERQSYSLGLDYDINPTNKLSFKGIYNRRNDWENRYRVTYKNIMDGAGEMSARIQTKGGAADTRNARLERQETMDFTLGGEHLFGKLGMDWAASYARATEIRPNERYFDLQLKSQDFDVVDEGGRQPYITNDISVHEGKWKLKELTNSQSDIAENDWKFKLNFELPLATGRWGSTLKFGAKYTHKTKSLDKSTLDYTDYYNDTFGKEYENHYSTQIRDGFMPGSQYKAQDFVSKEYLGSLDFSKMDGVPVNEDASGNYDATENVTAAYLRLDQKLGQKAQLTLGLRMEATDVKYDGWNWIVDEDAETDKLEKINDVKHSYVNWLPSVLFKYNVNKDFKLRASFTETLSRAKYKYLVPAAAINTKDSGKDAEVTIGNTKLNPAVSYNFDLGGEYYFQSVGLVSAGLFYKRINDYIIQRAYNGSYGSFEDAKIIEAMNGFDADLFGVEVAYQRDFGFIAPALKCLGFYGNYTYTHSKIAKSYGVGNSEGDMLPGSPEHMANASLFFEKSGFNLRLSYNFTSAFADDEEFQEDVRLRRFYDKVNYLDLNASYTWGKKTKFTIYADANNLLNQPLRYYVGKGMTDRTMQVEYYGVKVQAGFKVNL